MARLRSVSRSDEVLMARAHGGDDGAFEALYHRHRDAVLGYCLLRLGERQAAEDATQEVFLKAHAAHGTAIENVKAWLFTIARNVIIDAARKRGTAPEYVALEVAVERASDAVDATEFDALDVPSNVFVALRRLSARDRKAIILREFQDRTSQQIAEELDMRPNAVDALLCRARAAFGRAYAEVAEMPFACRQATDLIYRESGSGLSAVQKSQMDSHIGSCVRCASEYRRAHAPRFAGALLALPWLRTAAGSLDRLALPGWSTPSKVAIGAALAAVAVTPAFVGHVASSPAPRFESRLSETANLRSSPLKATTTSGEPVAVDAERPRSRGHVDQQGASYELDTHPKAMTEDDHASGASDNQAHSGVGAHTSEASRSHSVGPDGATESRSEVTVTHADNTGTWSDSAKYRSEDSAHE